MVYPIILKTTRHNTQVLSKKNLQKELLIRITTTFDSIYLEGPEGVKWELGFAFLEAGKWDFVHWDWDS